MKKRMNWLAAVVVAGAVAAQAQYTIPNDADIDFVIDATSRLAALTGGETTSGSAVVTVADTSGLAAGESITGTGIPIGVRILSVDSGTQITLSASASLTNTGLTFTVAPPAVPAVSGGTTDVKTITVTDSMHRIIDIGAGNILRLGAAGSLRRTDTGDNRVNVTGGTLTAGGAVDTAGNILLHSAGLTGRDQRQRVGLSVAANIVDNGSGAVSISKSGDYITQLSGSGNTYSGGTTVLGGYLRSTVAGNLGAGDIRAEGTGAVGDPGVHLNGAGTYNNNFFISGTGADLFQQNTGGRGAIWLGTGAVVAGTVTLTGNARITPMGASSSEISGKITGDFNLEIGNGVNLAMGVITLSNSDNDWTGSTSIRTTSSSGTTNTLKLGASEVIPHGTGKGNFRMSVASTNPFLTLDLNGHNETINGLDSYGGNSSRQRIRSDVAGAVLFTLGSGDASGNFFGAIENGSGTLSLTKTGAGTQILRGGAYSYTGATIVQGGVLAMQGTLTGTSGVTVTGGVFAYSNAAVLNRAVILDGGTFQHTSAANYAGSLTFNSGTLAGTNWGGNLDNLTIGANQTVSPGTSPGLANTGNQTWEGGGAFKFEINAVTGTAGDNWDKLALSNALDISALSSADQFTIQLISLDGSNAPGLLAGFDKTNINGYNWEFVSFDSIEGTFSSDKFTVDTSAFENDFAGGGFVVTQSGNALYVSYIPEPGTVGLALGGLLLMLARRRLRG